MMALQPYRPSFLARAVAALLTLYKAAVSPWLPPACRFTPTCSEYAREAILTHGFFKGTALGIWRILRCNPWGGLGYDPVPPRRERP